MTRAPGMRLTRVAVHPLKSTTPRLLDAAPLELHGLVDDRSWMVVDAEGVLVSAREAPRLLHVVADTALTDPAVRGLLRLRAPDLPELTLGRPVGSRVPVRLFGEDLEAVPAGDEADAWLHRALARVDVRLVWCDDPTRRRPDPDRPHARTAFADAYPVTLSSESSLRRLNDWITEAAMARGDTEPAALGQGRFRANLVVAGSEPFAEDGWTRVSVGGVVLRKVADASRCVITTLDPVTLAQGREPLATMARTRRRGRGLRFAIHLVPESTGVVRVGDEVTVLE